MYVNCSLPYTKIKVFLQRNVTLYQAEVNYNFVPATGVEYRIEVKYMREKICLSVLLSI